MPEFMEGAAGKPLTKGEIGGESWASLVAFHTIWRWVSERAAGDDNPEEMISYIHYNIMGEEMQQRCMTFGT